MDAVPEKVPEKECLRFTKSMRLRNGPEFQAVFSRRISVSDKTLVLYAIPNGLICSRLGLSISKKVTRTAPARNRWKRVLREVFRLNQNLFPQPLDLVFLVRAPFPEGFDSVRESVRKLLDRIARRLNSTPNGPQKNRNQPPSPGSLPQSKGESCGEATI